MIQQDLTYPDGYPISLAPAMFAATYYEDVNNDGYKDLIAGRSIEYQGSVREVIKQVRKKEQQNWK